MIPSSLRSFNIVLIAAEIVTEFRGSINFALTNSCDIFSGVSCMGLKVNFISFNLFFESLSLRFKLTGVGSSGVECGAFTVEIIGAVIEVLSVGITGVSIDISVIISKQYCSVS